MKKLLVFLAMVPPIFSCPQRLSAQTDSSFIEVVVRPGETLVSLFGEHADLVSRLNRINPHALRIGMSLKVPRDWNWAENHSPAPESLAAVANLDKFILVELDSQYLAGYENGKRVFWYPISSGLNPRQTPLWHIRATVYSDSVNSGRTYGKSLPDLSTPTGFFRVRAKDPRHKSSQFFNSEGRGLPMPWAVMFATGYWFHGTANEPRGLPGFPASHGCVRLFDKDARRLYGWARRGIPVLIVQRRSEIEQKLNAPILENLK